MNKRNSEILKAIMNSPRHINEHKGIPGFYSEVYFALNNGAYLHSWTDEKLSLETNKWESPSKDRFYKELKEIFKRLGFEWGDDRDRFYNADNIDANGEIIVDIATTVSFGDSGLHLHPTMISGVLENSFIPILERALSKAESFKLSHTRVREELFDHIPENPPVEVVFEKLMAAFSTKRRDHFFHEHHFRDVYERFRVGVLESVELPEKCGSAYVSGTGKKYYVPYHWVEKVYRSMVRQGYILESKLLAGGMGMRSANKGEQKALKKFELD